MNYELIEKVISHWSLGKGNEKKGKGEPFSND